MNMRVSSYVLDRYIAPETSKFTAAEIPDMSGLDGQARWWVDHHFMNNMLRGSFKFPVNAYVHAYLRRATGAFMEYDAARNFTYRFLESRQSAGLYAKALHYWEAFLNHAWQGYALLEKLIRDLSGDASYRIFAKADDSPEQRLNLLYNAMKHVESRIASGQILSDAITPVWLTNEGIRCTDGTFTFREASEAVEDLAKWANIMEDPRTMEEKLRAADFS